MFLILVYYFLFHITLKFERVSTILVYGRVTKETGNSREWRQRQIITA